MRRSARPRRMPARARAPGRAPAPVRRCERSRGCRPERQRQRAPQVQRSRDVVDLHRQAAGARLGVGDRRRRASRRSRTARGGARGVAHEGDRQLGAVARHVARPEDAPCAGPARARGCPGAGAAGRPPRPPRRRRSRRRTPRSCRRRRRRCRSATIARRAAPAGRRGRDPGRRIEVEPDAARAGDHVGARRREVEGARDQLPGDRVGVARLAGRPIALHEQRRCPGRVRGGRGRADHRDAGPDGGRGRRDDVGLQPAVLGRALRRSSRPRRRPASRARPP